MKRIALAIVSAALLVNAPRFALAFLVAEGVTPPAGALLFAGVISGLGNAALVTGGIGVVVHAWVDADRRGVKHSPLLLGAALTFLLFSLAILTPWVAGSLTGIGLAAALIRPGTITILAWLWSAILVASVDLVVAGAVLAYSTAKRARQPASTPQSVASTTDNGRTSEVPCRHCERSFGSVQALSAHMRWCAHRGEGVLRKP